jgi:hypothetical protein
MQIPKAIADSLLAKEQSVQLHGGNVFIDE